MPARVTPVVCALLLAAALGGVAGAADAPTALDARGTDATGPAPALAVPQLSAPETDNTITRVVVSADGSATWELSIRTRLETDADVDEYRAFQDRFAENRSRFVGEFREGITGIVANARTVTGREMTASGFDATTSIQTVPRRWGVVTYEFRWDGFAAVEGDRVVVGDVFQGGLFISEGDALEVVGPTGYRLAAAEPAPDETGERTATWQGREDFPDRRPRVVFAPAATGTGTSEGVPSEALLSGAALLVLALLVAVGYRRVRGSDGGGADEAGAAGGTATASGDGEELLADEDYVRRALAEQGGRMRQSEVKEALGWSRSKTSRVLGRMEADGAIRKLQLGRENVIDLVEAEERDGE